MKTDKTNQLIRRDFPSLPWSWWRPYEMRLALRAASTPQCYYPHAGQGWTKLQNMDAIARKRLIATEAGKMTERWYRDNLDHDKICAF